MASQMLASVKGMSACTTPNEASASTTEASWGCHSRPGHSQPGHGPLPKYSDAPDPAYGRQTTRTRGCADPNSESTAWRDATQPMWSCS
jgi:hypothetical protein